MQKLMKAIHKNEKGFTLVELMVVVVIIGILVAIAIPIYGNVTARAELRACQANMRTAEGAAHMWLMADNANALGDLTDLGDISDFIDADLGCPSGGAYTFDYTDNVLKLECDNADPLHPHYSEGTTSP